MDDEYIDDSIFEDDEPMIYAVVGRYEITPGEFARVFPEYHLDEDRDSFIIPIRTMAVGRIYQSHIYVYRSNMPTDIIWTSEGVQGMEWGALEVRVVTFDKELFKNVVAMIEERIGNWRIDYNEEE